VRPTLQDDDPYDDSGRIISLGDVRRRRTSRSRAPDRQYLAATAIIGGFAWLGWLLVLFTVQPTKLLTYIAFFAPLWLAVTSTGALGAYGIDWRRGALPSLRVCARRGALISSAIILNLAFLAAHRWSIFLLPVSAAAAIAIDIALDRAEPNDQRLRPKA
jgi:hypothetical protein